MELNNLTEEKLQYIFKMFFALYENEDKDIWRLVFDDNYTLDSLVEVVLSHLVEYHLRNREKHLEKIIQAIKNVI